MSWHKKDWEKLLALAGAAAATFYTGGAAAPALAAAEGVGEGGAVAGATAAAGDGALAGSGLFAGGQTAAAAPSAMSSAGMFAQVPGVSAGSQQAAMLAAQNEGMGGAAADLTARAAMPAVRDAYAAGNMGNLEYMGNAAKLNMAGMNDPAVWASRAAQNMGGIGKTMALNTAMSMARPGQQPQPAMQRPPMQQQRPAAPPAPRLSDEQLAALAAQAGISVEELKRRLGGMT